MQNSYERGTDATGLYSPLNGIKKSLTKGSEFVVKEWDKVKPDKLFIGHVRSRTYGLNTIENAHPFERGDCVLLHNGTINNPWPLLRKRSIAWNNINVDSDALAVCIDHDKNLDVLKEISGGAALLICDKSAIGKLYVFRNKERPLFSGYIKSNMYISSIEESLQLIGCSDIKEFKEDHLYTIQDGNVLKSIKIKNTPYYDPVVATNSSTRSRGAHMLALGCNLRAKWNKEYKDTNGNVLNLIKDEYYEVTEVLSEQMVKVREVETNLDFPVLTWNLNQDDIIKSGDLVISIDKVQIVHLNKVITLLEKDKVIKVGHSYEDGDVALPNLTIVNNRDQYVKKYYFIKLTEVEVRQYYASLVRPEPVQISEAVNTNFNTHAVWPGEMFPLFEREDVLQQSPIVQNSNDCPFDPDVSIETYNSIKITMDELNWELSEHFSNLHRELKHIRGLCAANYVPTSLLKQITRLMKTNKELVDKIYKIENDAGPGD